MNVKKEAIYFSRAPIPSIDFSPNDSFPVFKQVCVIPFRRAALRRFAALPPTPLERAESIDMLRVIEHGVKIRLAEIGNDTQAVDTPDDLRRVEELMRNDPLFAEYDKVNFEGVPRR